MRVFKTLQIRAKTLMTVSVWGEEENFKENLKHLLEDILKDLE